MSYHHYTPQATGTTQPTASYPYGAYTAYGYQTGYQWPYPYSYGVAPQQTPVRPATTASPAPAATPTVASPAVATQAPRSTNLASYTPSYAREPATSTSTGGGGRSGKKQSNVKGLFNKELRNLMYGFGDDRNPANDTVNVMEEILVEYITDVCLAAAGGAGGPSRKARLSIEDLRRVLSRPADAKKLARMEELLFMQEDIKRARAQFEESDMQNPRGAF
ncbi:hypothetical protein V5O48_000293 [Marasmius crinis-equi]|uniref:Transcription initiation factor TFIID subunit 13 n=1 Tax=Marasmius crinis-equi TaxID=585013 RepID=A0ABR3G2M5_9AGAR